MVYQIRLKVKKYNIQFAVELLYKSTHSTRLANNFKSCKVLAQQRRRYSQESIELYF